MTNEQKFSAVEAKLDQDPAAMAAFLADPLPTLKAAQIPLIAEWSEALDTDATAPDVSDSEGLRVKKHWWGFDFIMNEKLTQDLADGSEGGAALAGLLMGLGGIGAAIAGGVAAAMVEKMIEIKIADGGKGVHWPITWIQWGALLAAAPLGPNAVAAQAVLWLHPLRNK